MTLRIKEQIKSLIKFIIDGVCFFVHMIHRITNDPIWLMLEFEFLTFCGNNIQNISIMLICNGYAMTLMMQFLTEELRMISNVLIMIFVMILIGLTNYNINYAVLASRRFYFVDSRFISVHIDRYHTIY